MKPQNKSFFTYTTLRKIAGMNIPAPLQNMYIKNYCHNNNLKFSLPIEEYIFEDSYIELFGILEKFNKNYSGLITFSIYCLPNKIDIRNKFLEKTILKQKEIHFIFEKIILKNIKDIEVINLLYKLKKINSKSFDIVERIKKNKFFI